MPGPISHGGWRRHMRIARNAANADYGAMPGAPDWQSVPILADGMKLKATAPHFVPDTNYGGDFRRHVAIHNRQEVAGDIVTLPWPEVTQYLLDMALLRVADGASQNYEDVYGHVIDFFTPPDPRRYYGVVANTLRIAATGTGDNDVQLTLSCIAQREVENNALVEANFDYSGLTQVPFMFGHAQLRVDTINVFDIETWELVVENNIGDAPFLWNAEARMSVRVHGIANQRTATLTLSDLNKNDRYNEAIRDANLISFEALFTHPDGHLWQLILPSLYVEESDEDGTPSVQATENPRLEVRAADSGVYAGEDIVSEVDLSPGGTTTMEWLTTTTAAPVTTTTTAPL